MGTWESLLQATVIPEMTTMLYMEAERTRCTLVNFLRYVPSVEPEIILIWFRFGLSSADFVPVRLQFILEFDRFCSVGIRH